MQRDQSRLWNGSRKLMYKNLKRSPSSSTALVFLFFLLLFVGALISLRWINNSTLAINTSTSPPIIATAYKQNPIIPSTLKPPKQPPPPSSSIPFTCPSMTHNNITYTCLSPPSATPTPLTPSPSCPDYFRYIHQDLLPWKATGITRDMIDRAKRTANFRLIVLNGRAYIESYRRSFQSRDVFTLWGIVQLLRRYPGRVPDLELMFDCVDWPVVRKNIDYRGKGKKNVGPPPLFRYCGDEATLDIVFPDWSFWGWPEINIKPWGSLLEELKEGNKKVKWMDRELYAYWKGNPAVAATRQELLKCNVSEGRDWNARIYAQDWLSETKKGFKQSDLASQCNYRYKIYIEGSAWSVSEKYILACNSPSLIVDPHYYDFFTRGLVPVHHYWPIRDDDKCRSIKFAVDWGNSHKQKAQAIGKEASTFIQEKLKMDYVYDYMYHLLSEYAKLLKFKPSKPRKAIELCAESMACPAKGIERKFMMESLVKAAHSTGPCSLPPPYNPGELKLLQRRKANSIKQVGMWEQKFWESKSKQV